MKRILYACLVALLALGTGTANATSTLVGGTLAGKGGYWFQMNKGFLFNEVGSDQGPVNISSFDFLSAFMTGADKPTKVSLTYMGDASDPLSHKDITASTLTIYGLNNEVLLTASINSPGFGYMNINSALGAAGQFDLYGSYIVSGGKYFDDGLVNGTISLAVNYANGLIANSQDFHFTGGKFEVGYNPVAPVPEPTTSVLLLSSLAGIAARRKKASKVSV